MLAFFASLFAYAFTDSCENTNSCVNSDYSDLDYLDPDHSDNCISFTVGAETGCDWMCQYCSNQLVTDNYYFIDDVCTYQPGTYKYHYVDDMRVYESGGCVGNPMEGVVYTCCSV